MNIFKNDYEHTINPHEFTDQEIKEQLYYLGFKNISQDKFKQFKRDLGKLITSEQSMSSSNNSYSDVVLAKQQPKSKSPQRFSLKANKKVSFPDDSQIINSLNNTDLDQTNNDNQNEDVNENDQSFASITTTSSIIDNKVIKRKIIRKSNNTKTFDLLKPKPSDDILELNENFKNMKLPSKQADLNETNDTLKDDTIENANDDDEDEYNTNFYDYETQSDDEQLTKLNEYYPPVSYPVKSFIRSQSSLSLRSNKSDFSRPPARSNPVQKFQQYQKMWNKQKVPGEKRHNDLRWSIREQMLEKHVIVKRPTKSYAPNEYKIPTEKKRQQLRWMVRSALANPV